MNAPRYLVVAGNTALTPDQEQQLVALQAEPFHFEFTTDSVSYLIESGDGLVLNPGWEDDPRAVLEVQVAQAFGMPAKTHLWWLQHLPTPDPDNVGIIDNGWWGQKGEPSAHYAIEGDTIHLLSGEIIFDDPTITTEGVPHFADVVNLEPDEPAAIQTGPECKHRWVLTEEGVRGCEECGAAA